ncbi:MAG: hypothetical protein ACT4OJ_05375 [Bacteroidota bacterium]
MRSTIVKWAAVSTLLFSFLLQGCTKEASTALTTQSDFSNSSLIRVFIATVNASRNYIYVDNKPINGSGLASGGMFPAAGVYASNIPPGVNGFLVRDTLSTTTQVPLSFAENLQVARNYTIFMYDTITTPKQKTVETRFDVPNDNTARIRFAHFPYLPDAVPAVDIYSKKKNANIFSNIQLTDVTNFASLQADLIDTFYVRLAGSGANLMNYNNCTGQPVDITAVLTPRAQRSYTLVFRGGFRSSNLFTTCPNTANPNLRQLSVFTDR